MGSARPTDGPSSTDDADTLVVSDAVDRSHGVTPPTAIGAAFSRYRVLEEIGRGGMGRVVRAYDPKLQREVALKELRDGALGEEGSRRLVGEARAMAKLSHPNVVAVYDVEDLGPGRLVLVMEYVAGTTLARWLRETEPTWRDVVVRFCAAGRGLAAAHASGLLHRDFKPNNVLVAEDGAVKVTDFGLAKVSAEDMSSAEGSAVSGSNEDGLTEAGQVLGTPRYMAPEQHQPGRGMDSTLTAAADQYALCVALWEALCGAPPFYGNDLAARKHEGPPAWPNPRVPAPIARAVTRGLAVRPRDRWPSVDALLDALAWDPRQRRQRWLLSLGGIGVLGIAGLTWNAHTQAAAARCTGHEERLAGIWDGAGRAEIEQAILAVDRPYAPRVWTQVEQAVDGYADAWVASRRAACEATSVRGEQSAEVMDLRMTCLHRARVSLDAVAGQLADADSQVVDNVHDLLAGLPPLSRCDDIEALRGNVEPPRSHELETVEQIRGRLAEAMAGYAAGRYPLAKEHVDAARSMTTQVEYGPVQTEVALAEGIILDELGEYEAAEAALREALALAARWRQRADLGAAASALMRVVGSRQQRAAVGLRYFSVAWGMADDDPNDTATAVAGRASVHMIQAKYDEAEEGYRRALAILDGAPERNELHIATIHNHLADALGAQARHEDAEAQYRRALALKEEALGANHPDVASSYNNLGAHLTAQGRYEESEAALGRARTIWEGSVGPEHPSVAAARSNLAHALYAQRKYAEAEAESRWVLKIRDKTLGADHPDTANSHNNIAAALYAQGRHPEAVVEIRLALGMLEASLGPDHPTVATTRSNLATILAGLGLYEEAEPLVRSGLAAALASLGPDHPTVATLRERLASVLLQREQPEEALSLAEESWRVRKGPHSRPAEQAQSAFVLAQALWQASPTREDRQRALTLAQQALVTYEDISDDDAIPEVRAWLQTHRGPR